MKNQSRFRISHLILSVFLVSLGGFIGYLMLYSWKESGFYLLYLLAIPLFCVVCVLPVYAGIALLIDDIKKIRANESTAYYEESKDN